MSNISIQSALEQADALVKQGNRSSAVVAYQDIVEQAPDCAQAWSMLGLLHRQSGNPAGAETCYRTATELNPRDAHVVSAWCALVSGVPRPGESYQLLGKLLKQDHDGAEIWFHLAILCSKLGRHADALDCIDKAVANGRGAHKYLLGRADIMERRGDFEEAFDILKPYLEAQRPNIGAVLVFSRFSHVVGLRPQCLKLLNDILSRKEIPPAARTEVTKAIAMVNDANLS